MQQNYILLPVIKNKPRVFCLYCELKEEVNPDVLQGRILNQTIEIFPRF